MPISLIAVFAEQLPRLKAEESLLLTNAVRLGMAEDNAARRHVIRDLERQAGVAASRQVASPTEMRRFASDVAKVR